MDDEEFNALADRFGLRLKKVRVKRLFCGGSVRPTKRIKKGGALDADVIVLIHDRVHELNVLSGGRAFLTQRDWLEKDLDWLIEHCGWLFALIREEEVEFILKIQHIVAKLKEVKADVLNEVNPGSFLSHEWTLRFPFLLSRLFGVFPSDVRDEIVVGEIHDRVIHLQRHWTKMRGAIRQVNDGEGLSDIRSIVREMGGVVTVKEWEVRA